MLQDFKSAQPPLEWLLQTVPHLKPRQFSIASSLSKHPATAHITMAVVDYRTPYKRRKLGVCSSWLASLKPAQAAASQGTNVLLSHNSEREVQSAAPDGTHAQPSNSSKHREPTQPAASDGSLVPPSNAQELHHQQHAQHSHGDRSQLQSSHSQQQADSGSQQHPNGLGPSAASQRQEGHLGTFDGHVVREEESEGMPHVPVWVEEGVLHLPPSHITPMVMVGPGTGVAPFKSFLEERQAAAAGGLLPSNKVACSQCIQ